MPYTLPQSTSADISDPSGITGWVRRRYQRPEVARGYDRARFRSLVGQMRHQLDRRALASCLAAVPAGALVLDLACGTGRITGELAAQGYAVMGADVSAAMLGVARRRLRSAGHPAPLVVADAERLPLRESTFQAVTTIRFLHLLPRETRVSVLRSARQAAGTVIADYTVRSRVGALRRRLLRVRGGTMVQSEAELAEELREAGLVERRRAYRIPLFSDCVYLVLTRR
jgi:SAM-dependent methyltransferase